MLYAKVVFNLPIEGPFDYIVPAELEKSIAAGKRVWVPLRNKKLPGYVVGLSRKTRIKTLKQISALIDNVALLDRSMLLFTKELSQYYCSSWGEVIHSALPSALQGGRRLPELNPLTRNFVKNIQIPSVPKTENLLLHGQDSIKRWDVYFSEIKEALKQNKTALILLPDINAVSGAKELLIRGFDSYVAVLYRNHPQELSEWMKIKEGRVTIVLATRSGIFAPLKNLGLIIIDEEENPGYKQDQAPHYHAREAAFMRAKFTGAKLVLGSALPSLESFYSAARGRVRLTAINRERVLPEIKIINTGFMRAGPAHKNILVKYLEDAIAENLSAKGKTLLFLNRKGFATYASCGKCSLVLKCHRCSINLVYHFKEDTLNCHYCNFKIPAPLICPDCNSSYIRYSGMGTEKIESELSRLFPQARIKRMDDLSKEPVNPDSADIFIAAKAIIGKQGYNFDLIGILAIDNSLNRIDFRAAEKTFYLLTGLLGLTEKKLVIQTALPNHYCFTALLQGNPKIFYTEELKQRKQLKFPPYRHMALVKLRGVKEEKVKEGAYALFEQLRRNCPGKALKIVSVNPGQPYKLRGKFHWQILLNAASPVRTSKFLKSQLDFFPRSGIIVTVDIDPI